MPQNQVKPNCRYRLLTSISQFTAVALLSNNSVPVNIVTASPPLKQYEPILSAAIIIDIFALDLYRMLLESSIL